MSNSPSDEVSSKALKNAGEHKVFATGAQRDTSVGRGRYDLISPLFLKRLAIHLEKGACKYKARNWEKGIPLHRCAESLIRHFNQWLNGENDEDHLAAVSCNIMFIVHLSEKLSAGLLPEELLVDMPPDLVKLLRHKASTIEPSIASTIEPSIEPSIASTIEPEVYCVECKRMNKEHQTSGHVFRRSKPMNLSKHRLCIVSWSGQHYIAQVDNKVFIGDTDTKAFQTAQEGTPCMQCGQSFSKHTTAITSCKEYT